MALRAVQRFNNGSMAPRAVQRFNNGSKVQRVNCSLLIANCSKASPFNACGVQKFNNSSMPPAFNGTSCRSKAQQLFNLSTLFKH
jgi:hypothetical protein